MFPLHSALRGGCTDGRRRRHPPPLRTSSEEVCTGAGFTSSRLVDAVGNRSILGAGHCVVVPDIYLSSACADGKRGAIKHCQRGQRERLEAAAGLVDETFVSCGPRRRAKGGRLARPLSPGMKTGRLCHSERFCWNQLAERCPKDAVGGVAGISQIRCAPGETGHSVKSQVYFRLFRPRAVLLTPKLLVFHW